MANVKIKVDPQETKGVKLNTTATAMSITAIGDIGSGDGSKKPNIKYYFKNLQNDSEGNLLITAADLEGLDYSKTLTAEINGVKYPAEYYYHPRGYIPYFTIYPNDEMISKYEELYHVDTDTHSGEIFNINLGYSGTEFRPGTNSEFWSMETGITLPAEYGDPMPILNISIYEEIAADDECCIIGIVYDTETNKWKFDGEDDPLDLIDFVMGLSNKNGHPRSYYRERVFYKIDFKNTENSPLDVIYLNAFEKYSERTDEDSTTTLTLRSTSNYVTLDYEDSTVVLEIAVAGTRDSTTYEVTRSHSITVKVGGSQFPTV